MPEPFDRLWWPAGLSSVEILWVWLGDRIKREKFEMCQSASEQVWVGLLGLVLVISPWLYLTRGSLEPFAGRPSNLGHLSFRIEQGDCHFMTRHQAFGMQQLHEFNVRFNLKRKQDYRGDMSDGELLPDVSVRGLDPNVCDEVAVTCIRIAILCFCHPMVIRVV